MIILDALTLVPFIAILFGGIAIFLYFIPRDLDSTQRKVYFGTMIFIIWFIGSLFYIGEIREVETLNDFLNLFLL